MTAELSKAPTRPERCPECGYDTSQASTVGPRATLLIRLIPPLTIVVALAGLAYWLYATRSVHGIGSGSFAPHFVEPAFTLAGVLSIAEGKSPHVEGLFDAVRAAAAPTSWMRAPGDPVLECGFFSTPALRQEVVTFGWPVSWYRDWRWSMYADAVRRSGAQPIVTSTAVTGFTSPNASISPLGESSPRPRWSWMGATLAYRPPPEETGGIAVWKDIDVLGIAASLGVIAFAWLIAGLLVWLWNQTLRRRELAASPKWGRRIAVVATVALMLVLAWVTMSRTDTPRVVSGGALPKALATRVKGLNAPVATSLNSAALEAISRAPDCDRQLAQVIIGAVDVAGSDTEALLAVVLQPEAIMKPMSSTSTSYNWSFQLLSTSSRYFTRRPASDAPRDPLTGASPVGEPMTFPAGWEWEFGPSSASIRRSTGNPTDPVHYISISLEWLGCLFLALWILWLVARIPTHVFVVRQRLRRRRNQCTACGHALGPAQVA